MNVLSPMRLRILLPIIIITVVLTGSLVYARTEAIGQENESSLARHESEVIAASSSITQAIAAMRSTLFGIEKHFDLHPAVADDACSEWLHAGSRTATYLAVFDREANTICSTIQMEETSYRIIQSRPYFTAAVSTHQEQLVGPIASEITGTWIFVLARPIVQDGRVIAVAAAAIDSQELLAPLLTAPNHHPHTIALRTAGGSAIETENGRTWRSVDPSAIPGEVFDGSRLWQERVWVTLQFDLHEFPLYISEPIEAVTPALNSSTYILTLLIGTGLVIGTGAAALLEWGVIRRIRRVGTHLGVPHPAPLDFLTRDELDAIEESVTNGLTKLATLEQEVAQLDQGRKRWEEQVLHSLNMAVEKRMPFLRNHGERVGLHAAALAAHIGLPPEDVERIRFAGQIHDIGKLTVPDAVYLKPGRLDPIEMREMQLHTVRGAELINLLHPVGQEIADVVRHHHERWDGAGYPQRLAGTDIPYWARIVSVADGYDAMTEQRPYRTPRDAEDALQEMLTGAGKQWDPELVEAFVELLRAGGGYGLSA